MARSFWETACQPNPGRFRPHSLPWMARLCGPPSCCDCTRSVHNLVIIHHLQSQAQQLLYFLPAFPDAVLAVATAVEAASPAAEAVTQA